MITAEKNAAVLDSGALSVWIFSAESTGTHISQFILLEPFDLRFNGFLLVNDQYKCTPYGKRRSEQDGRSVNS